MSTQSRSPQAHAFPIALIAELDALCAERERTRGRNQGLEGSRRDQRITELQAQLLQLPPPAAGSVLANARLERVVQAGRFGTVWRARRLDSGVECAVQVFHQNCASQGRMLRHFRQGIGALRALTASGAPPSIVQLFDADDSQLAFSMRLVEGSDLTDISRRGWPMDRKMQVFSGICEAVRFAHQKGVLHGDLRPADILYDEAAGCPVVTDFDLADVSALESSTSTGTSHGLYAAPEQRQGRRERLLESDIYSLGRLLQYLITERNPDGSPELGVGDEAIARIIGTCTRDDPAQRYGDVDELQSDVRRWRAGMNIEAARQSVHPPTPLPPQDLPALTSQSLTPQSLTPQSGTAKSTAEHRPRHTIAWIVAAAAMAAVGVSVGTPALQYLSGLVSGTAATPAVSPPDAGASAAPGKKPRRPPKRPRVPASQKGESGPAIAGETISRLFRDNGAAFQRCHSEVDLPVSDLTGRVTTRFRVDADGMLSEARVMETSVKATAVAECVAAAHNGLRLSEKPGQPTYALSRYDIGR